MSREHLAKHFHQYFSVISADSVALKKYVYKIRYDVYCKELEYEKDCPVDCEKDTFDEYSQHVLIKHEPSGLFVGCVRLVIPAEQNIQLPLPFEVNCLHSIYNDKRLILEPDKRIYLGELSRLAIHQTFRRRESDFASPEGVNLERHPLSFDTHEIRSFPMISVALYLSCMSVALKHNLKYIIVMMEPKLARLLSRSGINFTQIGEIIDYHGPRAMFYIDKETLVDGFKPELSEFYQEIDKELNPSKHT